MIRINQWLGWMALTCLLFILSGCTEYHKPISGPHSDPLTYPPVRGQRGEALPSLHEIPTGLADDYQTYPVLEPDQIVQVWVVGQTKSDIAHVHGHWLTINYRPSRFQTDVRTTRTRIPTGRLLQSPTARKGESEPEGKPGRQSSPGAKQSSSTGLPPTPGQWPPSVVAPRAQATTSVETEAVKNAYRQIQQHLQTSGAGRALEQQIRNMTNRIQQQTGGLKPGVQGEKRLMSDWAW